MLNAHADVSGNILVGVPAGMTASAAELSRPALHAEGPFGALLGAGSVRLHDGELGRWQRRNVRATVPHAIRQLRERGIVENFTRLEGVGEEQASYAARFPFVDTDLYKTVEGIAYVLASTDTTPTERDALRPFFDEAVEAIAAAQQPDGYVGTYLSGSDAPYAQWSSPENDHELYNLGHLIQAAVAAKRQLADPRLLTVAVRFAELVLERFGPGGADETYYDGHPGIEMALVELARETGRAEFTDLAAAFIERRGSGLFRGKGFTLEYFQDHARFADISTPIGHAVRFCYLAAGATDVAIERGDTAEITRLLAIWDEMVAKKSYITGGLGSRHSGEDFGDAYELSSERAYAETCAAIGAMQWGWRLLLATGESRLADQIERILYNAFASGVGQDGTTFFYSNPLQIRHDNLDPAADEPLRKSWYSCACCPPNVIRWIAELQDHLAFDRTGSLTIVLATESEIVGSDLSVRVRTDTPWQGATQIEVTASTSEPTLLRLRAPKWASEVVVRVNGVEQQRSSVPGWIEIERVFSSGDIIELDVPYQAALFAGHPSIDAVRGAAAIARGPLVYCLEQGDVDASVDDIILDRIDNATPEGDAVSVDDPRLLAHGRVTPPEYADAYLPIASAPALSGEPRSFPVVPYFHWANRIPGAMRVWMRREPLLTKEHPQRGNNQ